MKMIAAGSADISNYALYSKNCNLNGCSKAFFVPVPSLSNVQLFINFGSSSPGSVSFTMFDLCNGVNTSVSAGCFIIGFNPIGLYWYGIFKNFTSSGNYASYIIAAQARGNTFFSEQYMNAQSCETLSKVQVCYPYNYNDEDVNGIYIGEPDSAHSVSGIATLFYQHSYWVRDAEIIETQNKISFTSNGYKNFSTTLNKLYEFRSELVPGWYKDYLLSAYFRGNILINDAAAIVTDLAFENVNEGGDLWKAYAVLGRQVKGAFGCAPFICASTDCDEPPPPVCTPVSIVGSPSFPDAVSGVPYDFTITLSGTAPYTVNLVGPGWMIDTPSGNNIVFSGTPSTEEEGTNISVILIVTNCSGTQSDEIDDTIDVNPASTPTNPQLVFIANPSFGSGDYWTDVTDACAALGGGYSSGTPVYLSPSAFDVDGNFITGSQVYTDAAATTQFNDTTQPNFIGFRILYNLTTSVYTVVDYQTEAGLANVFPENCP